MRENDFSFFFPITISQPEADRLCVVRLGCGGGSRRGAAARKLNQNQLLEKPVTLYNPAMREDKNITRKRGRHFSSFDNVKSKVRLFCRLILKRREKERERAAVVE